MSSVSGAGGSIGSPLPKWQLALAVGAPVAALGLGYMYYRNSSGKGSQKNSKQKEPSLNGADKQISIDGDLPAELSTIEALLRVAQKYKEEGNKLFREGKFDAAIAQYNKAIANCPDDQADELAIFYQNRAASYEQLNNYSAVREDCTVALTLKPHYSKALVRRAQALEHCKEYERSLEDLTEACMLEKFANQRTLAMANNILKKLGKQHVEEYMVNRKPVMPSKFFIKSYFLPFHSDPIYSNIDSLSTESDSPFTRAVIAFKNQDYEDIIDLCTEEIKSSTETSPSPRFIEAHLLRGTFYLLLGQYESSREDFDFVIDNPETSNELKINALIKRASLYLQLEDSKKTFQDLAEAEELNPKCSDIFHNRGQVHLMLENIEAAKDNFNKAVQLNGDNGIVYVQKCFTDFRYGATVEDTGVIERALQDFETAFTKFPDCIDCYILYAQVLQDMQEFNRADSYYQKAIDKDPNHATVYVQRGVLHLMWKNNIDKAVEYIKKALQLDDKCEVGYETLASIEFQRGNLKEAIALFDKALALCRTSVEMAHVFGLKNVAKMQLKVKEKLGDDVLRNISLLP